MARVRGAVLTERDHILISFLGIARYASTAQLHRLVTEGRDPSLMYRRLRKLGAAVNRPGESPCVRRLEYRRAQGTAAVVWALTPFGRSVAESRLPFLRPPGKADVKSQFLLHTLMLNDVLLGLVLALRRSEGSPLAELPFRWIAEQDEVLEFSTFHAETGQSRSALLKPDAILELPGPGRRLFVEAETGAHSIATASPQRHGAVLRKLERYTRYFLGVVPGGGPVTYYARAFPNGLTPELLFLVHSQDRKGRVERAVREWLGAQGIEPFGVRVMTFAEAPAALTGLVGNRQTAAPVVPPVQLDQRRARQLRAGLDALAGALNAARRAVAEHNTTCPRRLVLPPQPAEEIQAFRELIQHDLLGEPRPTEAASGLAVR